MLGTSITNARSSESLADATSISPHVSSNAPCARPQYCTATFWVYQDDATMILASISANERDARMMLLHPTASLHEGQET